MLRQRLRVGSSSFGLLGRVVLVLFALVLAWYGVMLGLLAFKASPHAVDQLSGYRGAYHYLAGLKPRDVTGHTRLIAGLAGLAGLLVFGFLAFKEIPRPRLTRVGLRLREDERGTVDVAPRAIERAVEGAVLELGAVLAIAARYGGDRVTVDVDVAGAEELPGTLRSIRAGAREQLAVHGLPDLPVNVTLTGFERFQPRELA